MNLHEALRGRKSVRAFRSDPVSRHLVETLLEDARQSPSATNTQPWKVHVVAGAVRDRLVSEVLAHRETNPPDASSEFQGSRNKGKEPYLSRTRALGKAMYGLIGIAKGDREANWAQWGRNYAFFDAPVGLIFTIDKDLGPMSYLDVGLFMQTFMLSATAHGLATCAQGAWNNYWSVTRRILDISDDEYIICGLSLGYEDKTAIVNTLVSEREPVATFATLHGF